MRIKDPSKRARMWRDAFKYVYYLLKRGARPESYYLYRDGERMYGYEFESVVQEILITAGEE